MQRLGAQTKRCWNSFFLGAGDLNTEPAESLVLARALESRFVDVQQVHSDSNALPPLATQVRLGWQSS